MTAAVVGRAAGSARAAAGGRAVGRAKAPGTPLKDAPGSVPEGTVIPLGPKPSRVVDTRPSQPAAQDPQSAPVARTAPSPGTPPGRGSEGPTGSSWSFPRLPSAGSTVETGAGFLLGLFLWAWVGLPYLRGGTTEVKNVLRAKFVNKGPDGKWLP